jgi:small-conductance mechanosensitive channel
MIREIIESQEHTRFDRAHFKDFGASALNFEMVYYVTKPDFNLFMDIQQAINLAIYDQFAAGEIKFAYPTQRIYLESGSAP